MAQADQFRLAGQHTQALEMYTAALAREPGLARAHYGRGNSLLESGRPQEAISAYAQATALEPGHAAAHFNAGQAHMQLGQHEAAARAYNAAVRADPSQVDAHVALGAVQEDLQLLDAAQASYQHALRLRPDYAEVLGNLGGVQKKLGQLQASVDSWQQALRLNPDDAAIRINLGNSLADRGDLQGAMAVIRPALEADSHAFVARSNLLFLQHLLPSPPADDMLAEARRFGERATRAARPATAWTNSRDPSRCLRIGMVSGDFRQHPVGHFLEAVLQSGLAAAPERLQLFAYASYLGLGDMADRFRGYFHTYRLVAELSDEALAQQIQDDKIDILIDLSGHTAHNRLPMFAWKPAPVQVSWLGYFATTGVSQIDYLIADPWTLPADEEAYFTETVWRLPDTRLCFTPPRDAVEPGSLPALANGHITFGCFNNLAKMNDGVVALWARVLAAVPGSRLFLRWAQLGQDAIRQTTLERFAAHGVGAERLRLEGAVPREAYLAGYREVDMALDPFPYPGGTTTAEALWMGVPVLTLQGQSLLARQGAGLLMNAGLPQWIAQDADGYVDLAVAHAANLAGLAEMRQRLREQVLKSPLFDATRFAADLESALRDMWHVWCRQGNA